MPLETVKKHIMPIETRHDLQVVDYATTGAYATGGINHYRPAGDNEIVTCAHALSVAANVGQLL